MKLLNLTGMNILLKKLDHKYLEGEDDKLLIKYDGEVKVEVKWLGTKPRNRELYEIHPYGENKIGIGQPEDYKVEVTGLPKKEDGITIVVLTEIAMLFPNRDDLIVPDKPRFGVTNGIHRYIDVDGFTKINIPEGIK